MTIKRRLEHGVETVTCSLPMVVTVNASAAECRPRNARLIMKYKHAKTVSEVQELTEDYYMSLIQSRPYLNIAEWGVADVDTEDSELGLTGSPTKVKKIENIVFQAKESKTFTSSDADIDSLMKELLSSHTIG